jgi:hypothetical protein
MAIIRAPKSKQLSSLDRAAVSAGLSLKRAQESALKLQTVAAALKTTDLAMDNKLLNAAGKGIANLFDSEPTLEEIRASYAKPPTAELTDEAGTTTGGFDQPVADATAAAQALAGLQPPPGTPTMAPGPQSLPPQGLLELPQGPTSTLPTAPPGPMSMQPPAEAPAAPRKPEIAMASGQEAGTAIRPNVHEAVVNTVGEQNLMLDMMQQEAAKGPYGVEAPTRATVQDRLEMAKDILKERDSPKPLPPDEYLEIAPTNALIRLASVPRSEQDMAVLEFFLRKSASAGEVMLSPGGAADGGPGFLTELISGGAADRASQMLNVLQAKTRAGMKEQDAWKVAEVLAKTANRDAGSALKMTKAHKAAAEVLEITESLKSENLLTQATAWNRLTQSGPLGELANLRARTKARRSGASKKSRNNRLFNWRTVMVGDQADLNNSKVYDPGPGFPKFTDNKGRPLSVYGVISKLKLGPEYTRHINASKGAASIKAATVRAELAQQKASTAKASGLKPPAALATRLKIAEEEWRATMKGEMSQLQMKLFTTLGEAKAAAANKWMVAAIELENWVKTEREKKNQSATEPQKAAPRANPGAGPQLRDPQVR